MNCLVGCVNSYVNNASNIRKAFNYAVLQPWVELTLSNNGSKISVSNITAKNNRASIKSFSFGLSNGVGATFEIVDEEGGDFSKFLSTTNLIDINNIGTLLGQGGPQGFAPPVATNIKSLLNIRNPVPASFRFGWTGALCDGTYNSIPSATTAGGASINQQVMQSRLRTLYIQKVDIKYESGVFVFTVHAVDLTNQAYATISRNVYGGNGPASGSWMDLTTAVRKLFSDSGLPINVQFKQWNANATQVASFIGLAGSGVGPALTGGLGTTANLSDLQFDVGGTAGPPGAWAGYGNNLIQIARSWMSAWASQRGKGIVMTWDWDDTGKLNLVFIESNRLTCNDSNRDISPWNVGTYIINGSNCSPVISFRPTVDVFLQDSMLGTVSYPANALDGQTGYLNTGNQGDSTNTQPCPPVGRNNQGWQSNSAPTINDFNSRRSNTPGSTAGTNVIRNLHANLMYRAVTAEMVVQGDPTFDSPIYCVGYYLGTVFLNPFRVVSLNNGCEWLNNQMCNPVFSMRNWMIAGVSHAISSGSYTTTFKLAPAIPGMDIPDNTALGGGTYTNSGGDF